MLCSSFIALNSSVYLSNAYVTVRISGTRNLNGHTSLHFLLCIVRLLAPNAACRLKLGSQKAFMFFLVVSSLCDNYAQADSTIKEEREQEKQIRNQLTLVLHWEHHKPSVLNQKQRNTARLNVVIFLKINQRLPAFRRRSDSREMTTLAIRASL